MDTIAHFYYEFALRIPALLAWQDPQLNNLWKNTTIDPKLVVGPLIAMLALLIGTIYGVHRYNRWKSFKVFEDEMKSLDLEVEQEGTLVNIIKKYQTEEPVAVLYRPELFDEMATKEIVKVLGSAGSTQAKERFINLVYEVRRKTYQSSYYPSASLEEEEVSTNEPLLPAQETPIEETPS